MNAGALTKRLVIFQEGNTSPLFVENDKTSIAGNGYLGRPFRIGDIPPGRRLPVVEDRVTESEEEFDAARYVHMARSRRIPIVDEG